MLAPLISGSPIPFVSPARGRRPDALAARYCPGVLVYVFSQISDPSGL